MHEQYGPIVDFGYRPFHYVGFFGVDANRLILAERPESFRWREALASLIVVDGDTALVVSDGEEHRRRRRIVQPAFGTRSITRYLDTMIGQANRELDTWRASDTIDAFASLRRAVRRIAVASLFGESLGGRSDELGDSLADAIDFVNRPISLQWKLDLPWTRWHRARRARNRADSIVNAEIARRRASARRDADLLDRLLAATDEEGGGSLSDTEVRDQVVSLIAAGYDTTSAAAGWAVYELLVNPGEWDRAAAEVAAIVGGEKLTLGHLSRLSHLDHVVNETLRLWPPAFVSGRKSVDKVDFAGHVIPAGSMVLYSPYVTHRSAHLWPDPDRFDPDRWAGTSPDPYAFVPFGGGYRRCLGFAFATQELKVLLAELLRRTRLTLLRDTVQPTGYAALHPNGGVPVKIEAIRPAASGEPASNRRLRDSVGR
jgi:cytochrome P450